MDCLAVENLTFSYPNQEILWENISFQIKPGEFVLLCGSSGIGKSTLLRHFVRGLAPRGKSNGCITFGGKDLLEMSPSEHVQAIGFVMQNPEEQIVSDSVWHELAFGLENLGLSQGTMRMQIAEMANYLGIEDFFQMRCQDLSGGQKQLLNLASILLMRPTYLLLDEPMSYLDPIAAENFLQLLLRIQRDVGIGILITEHHLSSVLPHADKVFLLEKGGMRQFTCAADFAIFQLKQAHDQYHTLPTSAKIQYTLQQPITFSLSAAKESLRTHKASPSAPNWTNTLGEIQSEPQPTLLECRNLSFAYEKKGKMILNHLNLKLRSGEITAIMGANGCGKSTLLKLFAGILKPTAGRLLWAKKIPPRMVYLPQNPAILFSHATLEQELLFTWTLLHPSEKDQAAAMLHFDTQAFHPKTLLAAFGMEAFAERHPFDLSAGELQRVALLLLLLHAPEILLLDEATKGLDDENRWQFGQLLTRLKNNGLSIIMVSHDTDFCARFAQEALLLFQGEVSSKDTTRTFFQENHFYTTETRRISRGIYENVLLPEEVLQIVQSEVSN